MTDERATEIERRLDAGEWLRPGDAGVLFGRNRFTVAYWLRKGLIRYRRTPGGQRECNPVDVRRLLDEYRTERRGDG